MQPLVVICCLVPSIKMCMILFLLHFKIPHTAFIHNIVNTTTWWIKSIFTCKTWKDCMQLYLSLLHCWNCLLGISLYFTVNVYAYTAEMFLFAKKGHFYIQIFSFNVNKSYSYLKIFVLLCIMWWIQPANTHNRNYITSITLTIIHKYILPRGGKLYLEWNYIYNIIDPKLRNS